MTTIGDRVREARKHAGLTQRELADLVADLDHTAVSKIENGARRVASHELFDLAEALKVTTSQLLGAAPRSRALTVAGRLSSGGQPDFVAAAVERVQQVLEMDDLLTQVAGPAATADPPTVQRPTAGQAWVQGRTLAAAAREALGLGTGPVSDLHLLLESRFGAHVVAQPIGGQVHGLCVHDGDVTVVFVNTNDNWARQRYTAAHELAHILMDDLQTLEVTWDAGRDEVCERRAEAFAAYFLAPDDGLREAVAGRKVDDAVVAELMDYFGMSLQSMTYRLVNANLISSADGEAFRSHGAAAVARSGSLSDAFEIRARASEGRRIVPRRLLQRAVAAYREGVVGAGVVAAVVGDSDVSDVRRRLDERGLAPATPEAPTSDELV